MSDTRRPLSDAERLDWLRLIRSENIGPIIFHQLLARFGSAAAALAAAPELARKGGRKGGIKICPKAEAEREMAAVAAAGAELVAMIEPAYPRPLAAIPDAPPLIAVKGNRHLLAEPCIGIVGTRNASIAGTRFARKIAADLGASGLVVASGFARGIDAAAHEGALASGTVAVFAGGIDVVYPPEHEAFAQAIAESGVIIAESAAGIRPQARHFPRRNRLISGLSLGVVIIEAALKSGSLITARMALEQGREVFAVPGSPLDPRCHGANDLIRQGATLTESAGDVMRVLAPLMQRPFAEPERDLFGALPAQEADEKEVADARDQVIAKLGPTPVEVDEIIRQCLLTAPVVLTVLLELELAGRLERHPGNRVSLL